MELLHPAHPPHHNPNPKSHSSGLVVGPDRMLSSDQLLDIVEEGSNERVYVAVGNSSEKALSLLNWVFNILGTRQICLLHVHRPSPLIPTPLGKLPASQANAEVVSAFRREENEQTKKLIDYYLIICSRAKVEATIIIIENDQVHKGIVELVNRHGVRKLVMGAVTENCMKVKKSSSKENYAAKYAPFFCEIWFINKGKHVWTREASENSNPLPKCDHAENMSFETLRSESLRYSKSNLPFQKNNLRSNSAARISCARISGFVQNESVCAESVLPTIYSSYSSRSCHPLQSSSSSCAPGCTSTERRVSSGSDSKLEEESSHSHVEEVRLETEALGNESFEDFLKRKMLEAISKVKIFESAHAHEVKLRKEAEDALNNTIMEQEKLLEEKDEATRKLERTMRNVALLDSRAQEANRRSEEAGGELKLIRTSISSLRQEKQRIRQQKIEAVHWLERWRSHGQAGASNCNGILGITEELPELAEFSLSDLQTATCNFSESFKLGQGGCGCVYKGEMLGRTVAIKRLHPNNTQGQLEFQKEVQVLGKLQHPHLVTLLGACPEAWSLVYEYLPNGSLQDRLFQKSNISPLTWKIRARIIAEISSTLCFLHSSKPEKIVHGDLKPQNILLNSELSCKICGFGICRLVTEDSLYCPSIHRSNEPKGSFPYTDPEFQRIGVLTPKSDIYAFGVIILQLLTGKPPVGLLGKVRRTLSCGKLASILDPSAGEWPMFVARQLVDLSLQFCELRSRDRPDLTPTLVRELEQLHVSEERPVPSIFLCPILQEIMHDPQVAADGFTYEGEALREWLANGRETSPMTNLRLSHLLLTPNHALRLAIQDWLCQT
ncbi:U-box domain-containing protein 33-like [Populus alba x Populus x berolinensis]|uniref:RING-type E3 ubiquitin transferase n=1 Tax=Populus alba x Populus x berolinensis TaxID=444605 RepID=A0AAD6QB17_9ROSI|nr:U-box domain-containing protein 33-like [Populus alba x Populus x berolinensis]